MSIRFHTFTPKVLVRSVLKPNEYQTFPELVAEASEWIEQNKISVINIETLVVPTRIEQPPAPDFQGIWLDGESTSWLYQLIRVWYRDEA